MQHFTKRFWPVFSFFLALLVTLNAGLADALNLYVKGDTVNLRSGPSTSAGVVGKLKYRQAVSQLEQAHGGFYKVKTSDGVIGYVYAPLVTTSVPPVRVAAAPVAKQEQGYTVWMNTNSGVYHNNCWRGRKSA